MPRTTRDTSSPADLSFIVLKQDGIGYDYWNVTTTGTWSGDCDMGRRLAREYLTFVGQHPTNGNVTLLGQIVGSMADNAAAGRRARGAEVSFMKALNEYVVAVARIVEQPAALNSAA